MYRTKKISTILFTLGLGFLLGTSTLLAEKMKKKDLMAKEPVVKMNKTHKKLKPKHLYVKSQDQLQKEFFYKKQNEKKFLNLKKQKEQHINQKRIEKNRNIKKGENND